jgi:hypothetical protein
MWHVSPEALNLIVTSDCRLFTLLWRIKGPCNDNINVCKYRRGTLYKYLIQDALAIYV